MGSRQRRPIGFAFLAFHQRCAGPTEWVNHSPTTIGTEPIEDFSNQMLVEAETHSIPVMNLPILRKLYHDEAQILLKRGVVGDPDAQTALNIQSFGMGRY